MKTTTKVLRLDDAGRHWAAKRLAEFRAGKVETTADDVVLAAALAERERKMRSAWPA